MATRVTIGDTSQQQAPQTNQHSQIIDGNQKMSVTLSGGEMISRIEQGVQSVTSAPEAHNSLISSLQTPQGTPIGGDMTKVTDDSSLEIGGIRMTVANAMHTGFAVRGADGELFMTEKAQDFHQERIEAKAQAQAEAMQKPQLASEADAQTVQELNARVGSVGLSAAVGECTAAMMEGDTAKFNKACHELEQSAGAQGVNAWMEQYINTLAGGAIDHVEARGIDGDAFQGWMTSALKPREISALILAAHNGDKSGLEYVIEKFNNRSRYQQS